MAIRPATDSDVAAIAARLEDAFGRRDEAGLYRALRDVDDIAVTLIHDGVAEDDASRDGEAAGAVAAVAVLSRLIEPAGALALGPIAVARDRRREGLGEALIRAGTRWARENGHNAIFVLGEPAYYTRFGFSVDAARPFASPWPADFMMALELTPGALEGGGELRYPPAFAALG